MEHTGNIDVLDVVSVLCTLLQNQRNIQGRLRVGSKERLTFSGQLQLNPTHSTHQAIKVKGNFFHQLQVSGLRSILRKVFRCMMHWMVTAVSSAVNDVRLLLTVNGVVYSNEAKVMTG